MIIWIFHIELQRTSSLIYQQCLPSLFFSFFFNFHIIKVCWDYIRFNSLREEKESLICDSNTHVGSAELIHDSIFVEYSSTRGTDPVRFFFFKVSRLISIRNTKGELFRTKRSFELCSHDCFVPFSLLQTARDAITLTCSIIDVLPEQLILVSV